MQGLDYVEAHFYTVVVVSLRCLEIQQVTYFTVCHSSTGQFLVFLEKSCRRVVQVFVASGLKLYAVRGLDTRLQIIIQIYTLAGLLASKTSFGCYFLLFKIPLLENMQSRTFGPGAILVIPGNTRTQDVVCGISNDLGIAESRHLGLDLCGVPRTKISTPQVLSVRSADSPAHDAIHLAVSVVILQFIGLALSHFIGNLTYNRIYVLAQIVLPRTHQLHLVAYDGCVLVQILVLQVDLELGQPFFLVMRIHHRGSVRPYIGIGNDSIAADYRRGIAIAGDGLVAKVKIIGILRDAVCPDVSGFIGHLQVYLATLFEVLVRVLVHGVSVQLSIILVAGAVALIAISLVQLDHVVILVGEVNETVRGIIGLRPRIANITCTGVLVIAAGIPHLHVIGTKIPGRRPWALV